MDQVRWTYGLIVTQLVNRGRSHETIRLHGTIGEVIAISAFRFIFMS